MLKLLRQILKNHKELSISKRISKNSFKIYSLYNIKSKNN